ncbi:LysR substrate-binding domain-containing protein [Bosea sp. OK403]|uniref:LysR substrate-binding domain-containing protein n=1 Tax=Bosea sp. OK403 TaxID=1855286 RepID=UPI001FCD46D9|nr:LysR substrate-binding domain-containing protein [Bosea sp. OK403]
MKPQAVSLMAALAPVEEEWRSLRATATRLRAGQETPLRIASTPSIGQGLIARALRRLTQDYPLARVELIMGDPPSELSRGTADLGLMFSPRVTDDIALTPLVSGSIIALVRQDDPLAARSRARLEDLRDRRLICFDREKSPLGWLIAQAHERRGLDYAPVMTVPYSISAAHLMSERGDVSLVDSLLPQAQRFDGLIQLAIEPEIKITVCLMALRSRPLPRLASQFVKIMQDTNASTEQS